MAGAIHLAWTAQDPIYEELYKHIRKMDVEAIELHDENEELYRKEELANRLLYEKLNSLPKLEKTLLI